jgi:F-type H+-transporting ATPase subunit gamma
MGKTREIKKRIKAVGNIRRITKTMQMIATSKFAKAQQTSMATKPYTETIFQLVTELAAQLKDEPHPLLESGQAQRPGKELTLVLTSDRGLCGPYNGSVLRTAMQLARTDPAVKSGEIHLVGRKGASFLKFAGINITKQHTQFGDKPTYDNVRALAEEFINRFSSGEISRVRVVYTKYISAGRQSPTVLQLLPFETTSAQPAEGHGKGREKAHDKAAPGTNLVYEFIPSARELLDGLLPAAVKALLFQAFNDSVVSEHVARMVAMKSATDNAGKAGKRLTREYNRARQTQITTELTEIVGGAAALS